MTEQPTKTLERGRTAGSGPQPIERRRSAGQWVALVVGLVALLGAGGLAFGGLGGSEAADPAAGETIEVSMTDFAYEPGALELDAGTYTFEISNDGQVVHQWALSATGEHGSHVADTGELAPGESASVTVDLEGGAYEFACHVPGHYDAGMHGELAVLGADGTVPDAPAAADGHDETGAQGDQSADSGHDETAEGTHEQTAGDGHDEAAEEGHDQAAPDGEEPATAGEVVEVSMTEFSYEPASLELEAGTYTFVVTNDGQVPHEWALAEAGDHHGHGASTRQLAAGESQELTVELTPGQYSYMCHIEGHLEAGMEGALTVTG